MCACVDWSGRLGFGKRFLLLWVERDSVESVVDSCSIFVCVSVHWVNWKKEQRERRGERERERENGVHGNGFQGEECCSCSGECEAMVVVWWRSKQCTCDNDQCARCCSGSSHVIELLRDGPCRVIRGDN